MKSKVFALCASFTLMLAGCGSGPVKATGVELDKTSATMIVGDTLQLNATVAPDNAADKEVTWSASGDGIVKVEDGLVTALKAGESTVTVTTHDGEFTATCAITVNNPPVSGVTLDETAVYLCVDETKQLTATVTPALADDKEVTWSVTGTAARVSDKGLVTATAPGESIVTVTTHDGNKTASCTVTVVAYPEGTFSGTVGTFNLTIAIGNVHNGLVAVKASTADLGATGIEYNRQDGTFEIPTTGKIANTYSVGKITGKYDAVNDKLIKINCDGDASAVMTDAEIGRPTYLMGLDESTEVLQAMFKRRYMSGSWQVDTTNKDRFESNTTEFVAGAGSMKRRGYSGGAVAVNIAQDFNPQLTTKNIQYWVYNPSANDITLRMWIYKGANLTSNAEIGSVTAKAGQWTYVAMGFGSSLGTASLYNIQIADFTNSGVALSFDEILLF